MNKFFKCPPRDACSANPSPLGAGVPPPRQASEEEGAPQAQLLPDLATQYHHQMTVSAHFQLAGGRVNRGDRSGKSVYEREREAGVSVL